MLELQKQALVALAQDLSGGDADFVTAVVAAVKKPPRTTQEVGYYVSGDEHDVENCFRKLVSLSSTLPCTSSAEDKYCYEVFDLWRVRLGEFPAAFTSLFPEFFDDRFDLDSGEGEAIVALHEARRVGFAAATAALEAAFAQAGTELLTLDTAGGDTIVWVHAAPQVAERWRDVCLGVTHAGEPLGLSSPRWDRFWQHLCYATGNVDDVLPGLPPRPVWRALADAQGQLRTKV